MRKSDPENYLWAIGASQGAQRAVALALRAFNVETATAADAASAHSRKEGVPSSSNSSFSSADHQAALASARLLWWKEAAAEAAASASGNGTPAANHPVARALAAVAASRAVAPRSLSARLSRVAAARADDATGRAVPGTINDLESYGDAPAIPGQDQERRPRNATVHAIEPAMVAIPAGLALLGGDDPDADADELPQSRVQVAAIRVGRLPGDQRRVRLLHGGRGLRAARPVDAGRPGLAARRGQTGRGNGRCSTRSASLAMQRSGEHLGRLETEPAA